MAIPVPTHAEFIELCPEFDTAALSRIRVEYQLGLSAALLSEASWAEFYGHAVMLDAAHNLALQSMAGQSPQGAIQAAVGPITSASAAGISTSFATAAPEMKNKSEIWYSKTSYGQQFMRLRSAVCPRGVLSA